ncbi:MAG TPA: hypothetical protein VN326_14395 [Casimicrobiaceae bacterium]|nr:hypothetical protein [Casimicrobiaceae bacterium]
MRKPFRIGSGAGFSGDRLEPACVLPEHEQIGIVSTPVGPDGVSPQVTIKKRPGNAKAA